MADRVMVMYAGQLEEGTVFEIFDHPSHPYTKALLAQFRLWTESGENASGHRGDGCLKITGQIWRMPFQRPVPLPEAGLRSAPGAGRNKGRGNTEGTGASPGAVLAGKGGRAKWQNLIRIPEPLLKVEHLKKFYPQNRPIFGRPHLMDPGGR